MRLSGNGTRRRSAHDDEGARYQSQRVTARGLARWAGDAALNAGIATGKVSNIIVLDIDSDRTADHVASRRLGASAVRTATPIVLLGALKQRTGWTSGGEFVSKPYHYAPLIRRIEALLASRRAA